LNLVQMAALHHLDDVLFWDDDSVSLWQTYQRAVRERVCAAEETFPTNDPVGASIHREHHNWQNAVTAAALVPADACLREWNGCWGVFKNEVCQLPWPDIGDLHGLFQPEEALQPPSWKEVQDYVLRYERDLEEYRQSTEAGLRELIESLTPRSEQ